jgi:phospholipase/lecithinase/hemolysin
MPVRILGFFTLAVGVACFTALGDPIPVNQIVAFGDSLTDTGNASIFTLGVLPGSGYAYRHVPGVLFPVGEYTNPPAPAGPSGLWIDQFATDAKLPDPLPALAGGTNFAVAGAQTGIDPNKILGGYVTDQLNVYLGSKTAVPSTNLYTFWAGANDILNAKNPSAAAAAAATAASNLEGNITKLAHDGGKYFLWFNLPLLGDVPAGAGDTTALNAASIAFDTDWSNDIKALKHEFPNIVLVGIDIDSALSAIQGDPGKYGITGLVEPKGADLNGYLFSWDGLHPTSYADQFVADLAWMDFNAAITPTTPPGTVPEPATTALMLIGVAALARLKAKNRG